MDVEKIDIGLRGRTQGDASDLRQEIHVSPGFVTVRVDDARNPAAWIEVEMSVEQMTTLAAEATMLRIEKEWGSGAKLAEFARQKVEGGPPRVSPNRILIVH